MKKRCAWIEAVLMILLLQALLLLAKMIGASYTAFGQRMAMMSAMTVLSVLIVWYAKLRQTKLSVFPARFGKLYIISTTAAVLFLVAAPSNYTGGYPAILSLLYGSVATPIFEELLFRGYLWNRLNAVLAKEAYTYLWNILLFTVWHLGYMLPQILDGNWFAVLTKLAAGLLYGAVLGFVRLKCKNCYLPMLLHGVLNAIMI
ncbi:MAG: CPBP family intramembrane metalloprotease [Eubacteriales bacterium]|nr:CPBP family intramembrane metalloprotease [Eubacteriales bacterium]